MKTAYKLYEMVEYTLGNMTINTLIEVPTITWSESATNQIEDINGWVGNYFESEEDCYSKIKPLLAKERNDNYLYGISSYNNYTLLPILNFK